MFKCKYSICLSAEMYHKQNQTINEHPLCCIAYISPLSLEFESSWGWDVRDATLCDKVCQWLATGRWFSLSILVSFTNKTDRHDITEIPKNPNLTRPLYCPCLYWHFSQIKYSLLRHTHKPNAGAVFVFLKNLDHDDG
jgi:hypothetical protein